MHFFLETEMSIKRYELWRSESESSYSFFDSSNDPVRKTLADDAVLIWHVDALNLVDARILMHKYLGWEPYIPPDDADI